MSAASSSGGSRASRVWSPAESAERLEPFGSRCHAQRMNGQVRVLVAVAAASLIATGTACRPKIHSFAVNPQTVCPGEPVVVQWDARGELAILVRLEDPRMAGAEDREDGDEGRVPIAPDALELTLVARRGTHEVVKRVFVLQYPESSKDSIVFRTAREGEHLVAAGDKNPQRWGNRFAVGTVASGSKRTLQVRHAGKEVEIEDGETSRAFESTPLEGRWEIRSRLTADELRDPNRMPDRLKLEVTIHCKGAVR